jgi:hypothetical protein
MIATIDQPKAFRPTEPMPPDLRFNERADACAVVLTANGIQHRAVLELDGRGFARNRDIADMLESIAREVRKMPDT